MARTAVIKRIRTLSLCAIAAFVLASLFAASAQAKHQNAGPVKFTAASTNMPSFEPEGAGEVTCTSELASGEVTSAVSGHMTATFTGCATEEKPCSSAGQPEGTIKTEELKTEIGYISKAKGEVGTDYQPASGEFYAKFDCPGNPDIYIAIKESVIGRLEPANVMTTTSKTDLKGSMARQEVEKFGAFGPKDTLLFQVSTEGQAGWEKGEFVSFGGVENVDLTTINSEQEEPRGRKVKKYADPVKVSTTGPKPEYMRCRKAKEAKFKNAACTEKAAEKNGKFRGRYEAFAVPS
jgi:hypothetical protein